VLMDKVELPWGSSILAVLERPAEPCQASVATLEV
jgi:hypothetical protein